VYARRQSQNLGPKFIRCRVVCDVRGRRIERWATTSLFLQPLYAWKMAGEGNNLASPPYSGFCKVSLDARGTVDTALGELGKYKEGWSLSVLEARVELAR